MDEAADNPSKNRIGTGVTVEQLRAAVDKSGYPLQTQVRNQLRQGFDVHDEWSFVDRDSGDLRSIDLRANKRLWDLHGTQPRVRPELTLLIECKQSQLPYVFFEADTPPDVSFSPKVFGLRSGKVSITSDDSPSTWSYGILAALELGQHSFQQAPTYCRSFSKCARKGPELELSGTDAYNNLVLPLIKALQHLAISEAPVSTAQYFDAHLSVGLGVLDAPMVVARKEAGETKLEFVPWIRVVRHEYDATREHFERDTFWALDVVHQDFLGTYLDSQLLPFADEFAARVLRHSGELATGEGFASGMERNWGRDLERRLQPRSAGAAVRRGLSIGRNLLKGGSP